ncbi:MAG: hypothetical protein NTW96_19930 [Planctomycetia bacterium]|nr:hypothetical protein [Planctomycetia bacterium]
MRLSSSKARIRIIVGLTVIAAVGAVLLFFSGGRLPAPTGELTFDGDSQELKATIVVATLDAPIQEGMNAIWCASFLSAWKAMEEDVAKEPPSLQDSPKVALELNQAADPRPDVPKASMYVAAGWNDKGIVDQIQNDLAADFPTKAPPTFPGILPNSFVAYAYLEANVAFLVPYFQSRSPMVFTDGAGNKTELSSFGIRSEDDYAYEKLRAQPRVLFWKGKPWDKGLEFAVDLCAESSPSQIIVARINREPTLAAALARVESERAELEKTREKDPGWAQFVERIGPRDVLLVPDICWRISHHFAELECKTFTNSKLAGQRLDVAQQDISFRLDRSGAELKSESKQYCKPQDIHYVLDRPFLICMKKRDAKTPYFVMWVENAELLTKWAAK